jgi:hypothetical protein
MVQNENVRYDQHSRDLVAGKRGITVLTYLQLALPWMDIGRPSLRLNVEMKYLKFAGKLCQVKIRVEICFSDVKMNYDILKKLSVVYLAHSVIHS